MAETGMFYLVPEEQMNRIIEQLDRIEANTRQKPDPVPVIGNVLSAKVVAERLGVTPHTVYAWAREGTLRSVRAGGRVLFPETAVAEFMKGGRNETEGC